MFESAEQRGAATEVPSKRTGASARARFAFSRAGRNFAGEVAFGPLLLLRQILEAAMARKYAKSASKDVEREMHKFKKGTLKSGKGGKGGKVKSRKQAIAIGLSEARAKGKKVPRKRAA
jgi:hypothetical protein